MLLVACSAGTESKDTKDTGSVADEARRRLGLCDVYGFQDATADELSASAQRDWLDLAAQLGVSIVRPHRSQGHVFAWNAIDDGSGAYDFTMTDLVVRTVIDHDLDLLVTVYPQANFSPGASHIPETIALELPDDLDAYAAFVQAMVERYDGDGVDDMPGLTRSVDTWEVGNEPYCASSDLVCYDEQFELLALTADAIRAADISATVLPAGARPVFNGSARDDFGDWLVDEQAELWRGLFERGAGEQIDAFGFHMQSGVTEPHVDDYVAYWGEVVGDIPLWLTETGVSRVDGTSEVEDPVAWTEDHLQSAFDGGVDTLLWCWWEPLAENPELVDLLSSFTD
jgi:hypothetical protein